MTFSGRICTVVLLVTMAFDPGKAQSSAASVQADRSVDEARRSAALPLPDAPSFTRVSAPVPPTYRPDRSDRDFLLPPGSPASAPLPGEHFYWKGLLLQSLAFEGVQNTARYIVADGQLRHYLLNKPFWSDYWASLSQYNMRRWNDGDSFKVNYLGHPMEGAIAGYLEIQNNPRDRALRLSRNPAYWHSRFRGFLWAVAYSTQWEIGPLGEAGIFSQGGFTYSINCALTPGDKGIPCNSPKASSTNNTGWVDFIVTPTVGTLWLLGEDTVDRYLTDHLVERHPHAFKYKFIRSAANPTRSFANLLRGQYPWYRDYEHPSVYESRVYGPFERALAAEPNDHIDLNLYYSSLNLRTNHLSCIGCRTAVAGAGGELGYSVRRYLDLIADLRVQPNASPVSSLDIGGQLLTATFGLRSGYSSRHFGLKAALAPGLASYSRTGSCTAPAGSAAAATTLQVCRNFNFASIAAIEGEVRLQRHLAFRGAVEQMLIRYKSPIRDPPGIGTEPNLSFLSHDNYINSTNWGVRLGPVIRF